MKEYNLYDVYSNPEYQILNRGSKNIDDPNIIAALMSVSSNINKPYKPKLDKVKIYFSIIVGILFGFINSVSVIYNPLIGMLIGSCFGALFGPMISNLSYGCSEHRYLYWSLLGYIGGFISGIIAYCIY